MANGVMKMVMYQWRNNQHRYNGNGINIININEIMAMKWRNVA
jgi:hypothetical protein